MITITHAQKRTTTAIPEDRLIVHLLKSCCSATELRPPGLDLSDSGLGNLYKDIRLKVPRHRASTV